MELKEEILNKIISRAAELFKKKPEELNANTNFEADLKAKSVNIVQILTVLEAEYDVELNYMEFKRKKTFGEAAEFVASLLDG
ncbi:MAG: acyl carrier protein [Spirochaetes bacterium]|nr:acyl carrier protein [Spirochaetota bacterium]